MAHEMKTGERAHVRVESDGTMHGTRVLVDGKVLLATEAHVNLVAREILTVTMTVVPDEVEIVGRSLGRPARRTLCVAVVDDNCEAMMAAGATYDDIIVDVFDGPIPSSGGPADRWLKFNVFPHLAPGGRVFIRGTNGDGSAWRKRWEDRHVLVTREACAADDGGEAPA